jgi:glycine cleavage system H protein
LDELRYSEEHLWVRDEGDETVTLGLTDYAQSELGNLCYVELPNEGDDLALSEPFGSVECARLVTDLYAPFCCRVLEVNQEVINDPTVVNTSPYQEGWMIRAQLSGEDELRGLMSADDYEEYILASIF